MNQDNPLSDQPTSLTSNPSNTEILAPGSEGKSVVETGAESEDVNVNGGSNAESNKEHGGKDLREMVEKELNCRLELASSEKNAEFHKDFPNLPGEERLINDFQLIRTCPSCSPTKPKAKLYVTENYACRTPGCDHDQNVSVFLS
ncbi:hypothetical protein L218DRAFT_668242 [Marasmius fiardii PR-910]|nr:hypothetical protein L218DRAFT_668242 [Marasmius fiardii PR-910]